MEDLDLQLERQTFNLAPDRWVLIYRDRLLGELNAANEEGEIPVTVGDLDDMDRYFAEQEAAWKRERDREGAFQESLTGRHAMSGAQAPIDWRASGQDDGLRWGPWS